jgi:hypothetical protein
MNSQKMICRNKHSLEHHAFVLRMLKTITIGQLSATSLFTETEMET